MLPLVPESRRPPSMTKKRFLFFPTILPPSSSLIDDLPIGIPLLLSLGILPESIILLDKRIYPPLSFFRIAFFALFAP